ncbi:hypothetical protein HMPREF1992_00612 [Selenomonas sp. oral taxon 892 str. F0426]|nr:hypothetical protein [uncultured Selenomonas sp.]ERJ95368.1 hypothetical protein HMPREF1992_00612 [Selenomonas sp. oral taxon 892 str. F0426]
MQRVILNDELAPSIDMIEVVKLAQKAENQFVGMNLVSWISSPLAWDRRTARRLRGDGACAGYARGGQESVLGFRV